MQLILGSAPASGAANCSLAVGLWASWLTPNGSPRFQMFGARAHRTTAGAGVLPIFPIASFRLTLRQASRVPWTGETPVLLSRRPPESHRPVVAGGSKRLAVVRKGQVHAEPLVSLQRGHL